MPSILIDYLLFVIILTLLIGSYIAIESAFKKQINKNKMEKRKCLRVF